MRCRLALIGEIGPVFEHACKLGLEGIVSRHRDRAYRARRSANWIKVKNPASPATLRVEEGDSDLGTACSSSLVAVGSAFLSLGIS
jgi:ATP-dependent DNA ligase